MEVNKVYNEDFNVFIQRIPDESVDLIVTDPPYKVTSRGSAGNAGGMLQKDISKSGMVFEHNDIDVTEWMGELYRILKPNSHCYIMTNNKNIIDFLNEAERVGFHFIKNLIWVKNNKIMGTTYMSQFEYIIFLRKGRHKDINRLGTPDVLKVDNIKTLDDNGDNVHDTEKPVPLIEILVENSSEKGNIVIDPFCGIGSLPISCINLDRVYIANDIDVKYANYTINRIENHHVQSRLF